MPTYEYKCDACGNAFEQFQSIMAAPIKKCPKCKKAKVRRLIGTGAGVIFKGSGFYHTDYRSEGYKAAAKSDSEGGATKADSKGGDGKAAEGKPAESKPAAAAEAKPAAPAKSESKPVAKSSSKKK
jgi:putative FmdB family regulatory protein